MLTDRRKGMTKLKVTFCDYANAAKMRLKETVILGRQNIFKLNRAH